MQKEMLKDILKEIAIIDKITEQKGSVESALMDEISKRAIFQCMINIAEDIKRLNDETKAIFQEKDINFLKRTRNFTAHDHKKTNLKVINNNIKYEIKRIKEAILRVFENEKTKQAQEQVTIQDSVAYKKARLNSIKKSFIGLFSYMVVLFLIFFFYLLYKGKARLSMMDMILFLIFMGVFVLFGITAYVLNKREREVEGAIEGENSYNKEKDESLTTSV